MSTREWFTNLPGSPSIKWAAETSGVDRDTISRQLKHDQLSAEIVIKLCQAFGKSPVDGLVETGHIIPEDFNRAGIIGALQRATDQQIITEAGRRMKTS
jgi:hypothetical protein